MKLNAGQNKTNRRQIIATVYRYKIDTQIDDDINYTGDVEQ